MVITGGTINGVGTSKSNAFAVLDPVTTMNLKVGRSLVLEAGSGAGLTSASILNSGEIKLDVGGLLNSALLLDRELDSALTVTTIDDGVINKYHTGIVLIGGKGSGRFDFNNNALTQNAYPISWTLYSGAEFTIDTSAVGFGDAYIQSLAPRGVDSSLYGYLLFAIDRESTGKSARASGDQGNFTRTEVGSCN